MTDKYSTRIKELDNWREAISEKRLGFMIKFFTTKFTYRRTMMFKVLEPFQELMPSWPTWAIGNETRIDGRMDGRIDRRKQRPCSPALVVAEREWIMINTIADEMIGLFIQLRYSFLFTRLRWQHLSFLTTFTFLQHNKTAYKGQVFIRKNNHQDFLLQQLRLIKNFKGKERKREREKQRSHA